MRSDLILNFASAKKRSRNKYEALVDALKGAIISGVLKHGDKLPSTRQLAKSYQLSRGTVSLAYEMLWADGYLSARPGSGTFVQYSQPKPHARSRRAAQVRLSTWAKRLQSYQWQFYPPKEAAFHFYLGFPDLRYYPKANWERCMREALRSSRYLISTKAVSPAGYFPLREAIAKHLRETRGIAADPEAVVVTNGSAQAVALLIQLLVSPGDRVVIEDPSYYAMRRIITQAGGKFITSAVDSEGMQICDWNSNLAFVTPGFQYPTGVALSIERRLQLLQWADRRNALIIEDDFDCEFRRVGRPIEPLKVLDSEDRVIYVGTFSKSIHPTVRIGYALLPQALLQPFIQTKMLYEPMPSSLIEQASVALFIKYGFFGRHLRRMRKVYAEKHARFSELIARHLPDAFSWTASEIGLHRFGYWNGSTKQLERFVTEANQRGIFWQSLHENYLQKFRPSVMWGFSHLTPRDMEVSVSALKRCLP
jgi:GntR family transcriptional regulator / MocR family aminotransferase